MMRHDSGSGIFSLQNYGDSDDEETDSKNTSKNDSVDQPPGVAPDSSPPKSPVSAISEAERTGSDNDSGLTFSAPAVSSVTEPEPSSSLALSAAEILEKTSGNKSEGEENVQQRDSASPQDEEKGERSVQDDMKEREVSPAELISDDEETEREHLEGSGRKHHHHHHHHHHRRSSADDEDNKEKGYSGFKRAVLEGLNTDSPSSQGSVKLNRKTARLVSYGPDDMDESSSSGEEEEEEVEQSDSKSPELSAADASLLSRSVRNMSSDDIRIPPEPPGRCPFALQKKIEDQYENMRRDGRDLNRYIQSKKDFRNPSIYEKLIDFCHIDEKGTNFPPEIFDPHIWGKESFYDELDKAQRKDMERREKEKKERTKIEFLTGTKKPAAAASHDSGTGPSDEKKRRSKWDAQPVPGVIHVSKVVSGQQSAPGVVSLTTTATGTKATVIPAVGVLSKKPAGK